MGSTELHRITIETVGGLWLDKGFGQAQSPCMKLRAVKRKTAGLTLMEVLVIIAVLAVLLALLIPKLAAAKVKAQRITCVSHLKQVGLAFRLWSSDHAGQNPMMVSNIVGGTLEDVAFGPVYRHFQVLSNELGTPIILACPSDKRSPAKYWATYGPTNLSYFVGVDADETKPQMLLAGDRNILGGVKLSNGLMEITTNQVVSWSPEIHKNFGNIALADGSVQQTTSETINELIQQTGVETNRLTIP
jgi:prepilin-type processing-associated H-X9-DG protein